MQDVIIIGAGAAGIAAAAKLNEAKIHFSVLEARGRIGGRVHTAHENFPIELGPEFIHGETEITDRILRELKLSSFDVPDSHFFKKGKKLVHANYFWDAMTKVMKKIPHLRRDVSMEEALRLLTNVSPKDKALTRSFIQGFDASLIGQVSAQEMISAIGQVDDPQERKVGRTLSGYSVILEKMSHAFRAKIKLGCEVKAIHWSKNGVRVSYLDHKNQKMRHLQGKKLLITLPVSLLKAEATSPGYIEFSPPLYQKAEALAGLQMGPVLKIVLKFKHDFWTEKFKDPLVMLHTPDKKFQTWWTAAPMRWPLFTAWSGGDPVHQLAKLSEKEQKELVLQEFASLVGMQISRVKKELEAIYLHDWQKDPFSLGAYSFVQVGGAGSRDELAKPILSTLYFAGEATSAEKNGTVEGAFASGEKAAKQILHTLQRKTRRNIKA